MPLALRENSVPASRLEALLSKHAMVDQEIDRESQRAFISDMEIKEMKKRRLHLKQEIAKLSDAT